MLVKYKTILCGDKLAPIWREQNPNCVYECKVVDIDYCCELMKDAVENKNIVYFEDNDKSKMSAFVQYLEYGDYESCEIYYCPFCGKKINFKEVERVRLNAVEKEIKKIEVDYIEEKIK